MTKQSKAIWANILAQLALMQQIQAQRAKEQAPLQSGL